MNERTAEDILLDIGECDKIAGIEILEALEHYNYERLLPLQYVQHEVSTVGRHYA
jgi:uncharacterized protein YuzE